MNARDTAIQYAEGVLSGDIVAGRLAHLACRRFLDDLKRSESDGLRFHEQAADDIVEFFRTFVRHVAGEWARGADRDGNPVDGGTYPQRIRLEPWQVFILANVFGFQRRDSQGRWVRRFRKVYEEVARKNAKSTMLAGAGLYLGFFDGEPGAEVYSGATKRDQAKIVWGIARQMVRRSPELARLLHVFVGNISHDRSGSKFEPLGADADTMDGLNIHAALVDEYHAHKTGEVLGVLETATGSRLQPLVWIITTAGYSKASPCWEERCYAEKILDGGVTDDTYFAYIACPDEGDDWTDEAVWAKGNPNLGVSVKLSTLRAECSEALENPAKQNNFKRKRLNIWTEQDTRWLPVEMWDACTASRPDRELHGAECYGGLDLAAVKDTNAFALVFPPKESGGLWAVRVRIFLPADGIAEREKKDRAPYRLWIQQGWLELTDGNIADYDLIRERVGELGKQHSIQEIGFDPWNATQLATQLGGDGFQMVQMRQGFKTMSEPMKRLEKLVLSQQLDHGGNPLLRWMLSNVAIRMDANENIAPVKQTSSGRIDGIVATVIALGRAIVQPAPKPFPYGHGEVHVQSAMSEQIDRLELRYVPLAQAKRWDDNPKKHDLAALIRSIELHGFGDPPKYDATLGALIYGNGRTEALEVMRQEGKEPPRGIGVLEDGGWAAPVIFGVDAESKAAAVAFAVDHNNLTLAGGNLDLTDMLAIWDEPGLLKVLEDTPDAGELMASLTAPDVSALLLGPDFNPVGEDEQSRLDRKRQVTCPECGHEFAA